MQRRAVKSVWNQLFVSAVLWVLIGLFSGLQVYIFEARTEAPIALSSAVLAQVLGALPWIPATPLIMRFAQRFSWKGRFSFLTLCLYVLTGLLFVLILNLIQALLIRTAGCPLGCPDTLAKHYTNGVLQWGHFALLVYAAIVAVALWIQSKNSNETSVQAAHDIRRKQTISIPGSERAEQQPTYLASLTVSAGRLKQIILVSEIDWIEASGDYVYLHIGEERRLCGTRIGVLEQQLDPIHFARIHRSAIVNLERVREFAPLSHGDYLLILNDGKQLKLTRSRREDVLKRLKRTWRLRE